MVPTEGYGLFEQAETLGMTVRQLLTGQPGPLMYAEFVLRARFGTARARLRQQAGK